MFGVEPANCRVQSGGGIGVGETRQLEFVDEIAAGVLSAGRGGRQFPSGQQVRGQSRVVGAGAAAGAESPGRQEPATAATHEDTESGAEMAGVAPVGFVEVLVHDPGAGAAVARVYCVRGRRRVFQVGGADQPEGLQLHAVQVFGHVLDARIEEGVGDVGGQHAFLTIGLVNAGAVASHAGRRVGHHGIERVGHDHARGRKAIHGQVAIRIAGRGAIADQSRCGSVCGPHAVTQHDDDVLEAIARPEGIINHE